MTQSHLVAAVSTGAPDVFTDLTAWSFLAGVYLLPAFIGAVRRVRDLGSLTVINIGLGWTVVGWVIALAMAVRTTTPAGQTQPPGGTIG